MDPARLARLVEEGAPREARFVEMALVKQVRECEAVEAALRKEVAQLRKELEEVEES